jgi:hypothetical protein
MIELENGSILPPTLVSRVPRSEKIVLNFVLSYLEAERLPALLLVNGGYVRDLLLGKAPDDLDLSLALGACDPSVTIDSILHSMHSFALASPQLGVSQVNVTTILSDTSKDKNVDTAKAHMLVTPLNAPPERIEVDFMPTIGEETCDAALAARPRRPPSAARPHRHPAHHHPRRPSAPPDMTSTTACPLATCAAPLSKTPSGATSPSER